MRHPIVQSTPAKRFPAACRALLALLATGLFPAATARAAEQQPEVLAELARPQIYQGESVEYVVTLNHVKNPSPPDLAAWRDFEVTLLGSAPQNFRQTININGRVTTVERYGMQYTYRLIPQRSGRLILPAPVVHIDGQTLRGPKLTLSVVAAEPQEVVQLELSAEPQTIYPMQPFEVTLTVLVRDLPAPYADHDPLSVQRAIRAQPPGVEIPWADDQRLPQGLRPRRSGQRWHELLQSSNGAGLNINGLASRDIFSMFGDDSFFGPRSLFGGGTPFGEDFPSRRGPRLLTFEPKPTREVRQNAEGKDVGYWQYRFTRHFTPTAVGSYTFGPVNLKGRFLIGINEAEQALVKDVYAVASPITVTVGDAPAEGRPASYIGAIGTFKVHSELAPRRARVGDPMTLSLTIEGQGTLENTHPPQLKSLPEVTERFKVYEATEEGQGERRTFTYSLRPLAEGIEEFPSIPVSYFDVEADRYVTLRSDPIAIEIQKAEKLASNQIVAARRTPAANGADLQTRREGIFANVTDLGALQNESIRPARWLISLGGLAGLYTAMAFVLSVARRRGGDVALKRRQSAVSTARRQLAAARGELDAGRVRQGADHVQTALTGLVADLLDLPSAGLTPRDVEMQLRSCDAEAELVQRTRTVLDACDAARYGAADTTVGHLGQEAQQLVKPLSQQLKSKRRNP